MEVEHKIEPFIQRENASHFYSQPIWHEEQLQNYGYPENSKDLCRIGHFDEIVAADSDNVCGKEYWQNATCDNIWRSLKDSTIDSPITYTTAGTCCRNETRNYYFLERLKTFRMREVVMAGDQESVLAFRERALIFVDELAKAMQLDAILEKANDPFFLEDGQVEDDVPDDIDLPDCVKYEFRPSLYDEKSLACASFNVHGNFFAKGFNYRNSDQEPVWTSCAAFGIERWVWAILVQHGTNPDDMFAEAQLPMPLSVDLAEQSSGNIDVSFLSHLMVTLSLQALKKEPEIKPHFGLVSPDDTGAHHDMSYETLVSSAHAISPFTSDFFELGYRNHLLRHESSEDLVVMLRHVGLKAEQMMLKATKGVNTHKGAIFLLAMLIGTLGQIMAREPKTKPNSYLWFKSAGVLAWPTIQNDFKATSSGLSQTYGEWAYERYGIEGIRGVVKQGFCTLGYAFAYTVRCHYSQRALACSQMRLYFLATSEDTNILKRGGFSRYQKVRTGALQALHLGGVYTREGCSEISRLEGYMKKHKLSAAAAGDMLILLLLALKLDEANITTS